MSVVTGLGFRACRGLLLCCALFLLGGVLASDAAGQTKGPRLSADFLPATPFDTYRLPVDEGGSVSYSVTLSEQPFADLYMTIRATNASGRTNNVGFHPPIFNLDKDRLTFTPENWNTPQMVTVSMGEDDDEDTNWSLGVTHQAYYDLTKWDNFTVLEWGDPTELELLVRDNDAVDQGTLTITSVAQEVTEGDTVRFVVRLDPPPTQNFTAARVDLEWVGEYGIPFQRSLSQLVEAGSSTVTYSASTINDNVDELDGSVRATIDPHRFNGYQVGSPVSATVLIRDNDGGPPTVEITGVPPRINTRAAFTAAFAFSEDVTGFETGDVRVTGGTKGDFTAVSATEYTLEVTPDGSADVTVEGAANSATDGIDTGPPSAVSATATWDATRPTV